MTNLLILIITFFFVSISLIGYGIIFLKIFSKGSQTSNFGYLGIYGLVFSIFISYFTNFFLPHDYIFNSIYLVVGLLGFIIFIKKFSRDLLKKEFNSFVVIFSIALLSLLISKNHDDFPYYHFVYTYNLTQFDLNIGIGQFNHGFRTPSSIFYINSLFFLPLIKLTLPEVEDINMPAEGIFHNMLIVSINKKYPGQAYKVMNGLWGMGLLSLTKTIIVVDNFVNVHNISELAWRVLCNINYDTDILVSKGPLDDLDHSNPSAKFGAKLGIDATRKIAGEGYTSDWPDDVDMTEEIKQLVDSKWQEYGF